MRAAGGALLAVLFASSAGGGGVDAPRTLLVVANKGDHSVSVLDPATGRRLARIEESGVTGHEVAVSPDGRTAYVPIYGDSGVGRAGSDGRTIDVIDIPSGTRTATIDLGRAERPHHPVFGPDGHLYVTTEITDSISVLDTRTRRVLRRFPTGQKESHMVALTRDGRRAYTSNAHSGTVSAVDLTGGAPPVVIPVCRYGQRIALSVDDAMAFTADQDQPRLAVIDTRTNTVARWAALPGVAFATAATPDGRSLLVTMPARNEVALLDLATMQVTRTLAVPATPQEVVVDRAGARAYVSCDRAGQVAVIDLARWVVERLVDSGPLADGLALVDAR
jgi:DNA-binding beta-propeller fold protein YncE